MNKIYNKSLVYYLCEQGYRQKLICVITGYNQPFVSKLLKKDAAGSCVPSINGATEEQLQRKYVVDKILAARVLRKYTGTMFDEQDKAYIKLLDYCLVDRTLIRKLYATTTQYKISSAYRKTTEIIKKFDPFGLDIEEEYWQTFLKEVFKDDKV